MFSRPTASGPCAQQSVAQPIQSSPLRALICPYRGLEPFREEDAAFFFGRDDAIRDLFARVQAHAFVALSTLQAAALVRRPVLPTTASADLAVGPGMPYHGDKSSGRLRRGCGSAYERRSRALT